MFCGEDENGDVSISLDEGKNWLGFVVCRDLDCCLRRSF